MVVDAQIDEDVGQLRVAAIALDDEKRGRLLAATVTARRLCRGETVDQALCERARRCFEGLREGVHRFPADEDVPLGGVPVADAVAGPVHALGARPCSGASGGVDDAELSLVASFVEGDEPLDHLLRAHPLAQEREPLGSVARVRVRLRRNCSASASAHETTEPTARNFDCTATPHCLPSRATIEYVIRT